MKRIALVLVALGLAACGGEDCEKEVHSKEGFSMCVPSAKNKLVCVVEPDIPDSDTCTDCGGLVRLGYFWNSTKPDVCLCALPEDIGEQCNRVMTDCEFWGEC